MRYLTYLSLVFTMLLWGGTFIAGRALAGSVSPASAAFFRFAIATVALAVLVRTIDGRVIIPPRHIWFRLLLLGATGIFSYNVCFFTGLQHLEAGRASLIIALNPLAIVIGATLFLQESLTLRQVFGVIVSLIGAFFVITNGHPSMILAGGFGIGELAILGCVVSWAAYSIIGRTVLTVLTPLSAVFYSSLSGTLLLFPYALTDGSMLQAHSYSSVDWLSLGFLGLLGTAVGFSLYYRAIQTIGASRASVFINLVPFFAIILSWLLLGEAIGIAALSGGLLLLTGVTLTNRRVARPADR